MAAGACSTGESRLIGGTIAAMQVETARSLSMNVALGAVFGCLVATSAWSQSTTPADPSPSGAATTSAAARPRIALVLAGGGARGGAHIGVLKVL
jgi:hypothetical protein